MLLALDTCVGACSVAIASPDHRSLLAVRSEPRERGHAEAILPMIRDTLADIGISASEIDRIAVTLGPGSFTGVRVGLAAAKGLALARSAPIFGCSSLQVLAASCGDPDRDIQSLAVIDARRDQVYAQAFNIPAGLVAPVAVGDPYVGSVEGLATRIKPETKLTGNGTGLALQAGLCAEGQIVTRDAPDIRLLAGIARAATDAEWQNPVSPLYLRAPDAKRARAS